MARSIVLRFPATCVDCGAPIPAGATARWFGKGRVSCCGTGAPAGAAPAVLPRASAPLPRSIPAHAAFPSSATERAATDAGVPAEALACGLTPQQLATVAASLPAMLLLVRLSSGARFLVPAEHARHVIRCIEESLVDRVRDVTRSPNQ